MLTADKAGFLHTTPHSKQSCTHVNIHYAQTNAAGSCCTLCARVLHGCQTVHGMTIAVKDFILTRDTLTHLIHQVLLKSKMSCKALKSPETPKQGHQIQTVQTDISHIFL